MAIGSIMLAIRSILFAIGYKVIRLTSDHVVLELDARDMSV